MAVSLHLRSQTDSLHGHTKGTFWNPRCVLLAVEENGLPVWSLKAPFLSLYPHQEIEIQFALSSISFVLCHLLKQTKSHGVLHRNV